jgi:hypothetical protein
MTRTSLKPLLSASANTLPTSGPGRAPATSNITAAGNVPSLSSAASPVAIDVISDPTGRDDPTFDPNASKVALQDFADAPPVASGRSPAAQKTNSAAAAKEDKDQPVTMADAILAHAESKYWSR